MIRGLKKTITACVMRFEDCSQVEQDLLRKAAEVRLNAQAPYSQYFVGVLVLTEKGTIHLGCNVERCTWTQSTHAEQNAIDSMVATIGSAKINKVVLVAAPAGVAVDLPPKQIGTPISRIEDIPVPCGHCLQIIWENCMQDPGVWLMALASNGEVVLTTIGDAFPMRFGPEHLGVDYTKK